MPKKLIQILALGAGCSMGLVIAFFGILWWERVGQFMTSRFNPVEWKTKAENNPRGCYRGSMASDIRDNVLRKGMCREGVEGLLGLPDRKLANMYGYSMGMCVGWKISALDVTFDSNGDFSHAKIHHY